MLYKVRGYQIRSENAAKTASQACRWVLNWIQKLPKAAIVLDYGCGKFRYTIPAAKRVRQVYAVDSERQVSRVQMVGGRRITLRECGEQLGNVRVYAESEIGWEKKRYDFVMLVNVLSAIPVRAVRLRLLRRLGGVMGSGSCLLVVTQFSDSYFDTYATRKHAIRHGDGWILNGRRGSSFYGQIDLASLKQHCAAAGFRILAQGTIRRGKSAFVVAARHETDRARS